jgi:tetratricopeptide (TPR) repeat protein
MEFDAAAAVSRAFEAFKRGDAAGAERLSTEVCEKTAEYPAAWLLRGLIRMQQFRYEEAIGMFDGALAIEPDPWSHANKGACYLRLGQLQPALAATLEALALKPDFADALINLATVLHGMEDFEQALSALEHAERLQPGDHRTYSRFAATHAHRGDYERAEAFLQEAARAPGAFPHYGVVCFRKTLLDAIEADRTSIAETPRVLLESGSHEAGDYVVTAVCNAEYFYRYGGSFVNSYAQNAARRNAFHLHVMDPDAGFETRLRALLDRVKLPGIAVTTETTPAVVGSAPAARKTWYSCGRFLQFPALLRKYGKPVICLDIDMVFESGVEDIVACAGGKDIALRPRSPIDSPWLDCVANIVVANPTPAAMRYFTLVGNYIQHYARRGMLHWMIDQIALYCVLHMLRRFSAPPAVAWIPEGLQQRLWHLGHAYGHKLEDERFTKYAVPS